MHKTSSSTGATWFRSLGATWFTGATWFRRLAVPAVALAMLAALLTPASAASNTPATAGAAVSAADNHTITFSNSSFQASDVDLIPAGNLISAETAAIHQKGYTGQGVDIAIIDSGVSPVQGLDAPGKVFHGPDLSAEGTIEGLATLDTYGHGTHLAGIMAGNDGTANGFKGIAPDSRVVSVKIGGADGQTSVAQAVAAIEWVVENKNTGGLNIRVLNLSFGVTGLANSLNDPLSAAVERAWDAGIVVVAAVGNQGNLIGGVDSPALSPYVIAVAGSNSHYESGGIATWSSGGNLTRIPDVSAKGKSIYSLRVPGSTLDTNHPLARVGTRFLKGSGTSQSAALVSGYAALMLSGNPTLTPDHVKHIFENTAKNVDIFSDILDGEGILRINKAFDKRFEQDFDSQNFNPAMGITDWSNVDSWTGGQWNGATWSGATWSGATWSGATWSGATWSGATWSGATWSGATWSGATWSGATWSGASWTGDAWVDVGHATTEQPVGTRAAAYDGRENPEDANKTVNVEPGDTTMGMIAE